MWLFSCHTPCTVDSFMAFKPKARLLAISWLAESVPCSWHTASQPTARPPQRGESARVLVLSFSLQAYASFARQNLMGLTAS